jgi:hypothetical protein
MDINYKNVLINKLLILERSPIELETRMGVPNTTNTTQIFNNSTLGNATISNNNTTSDIITTRTSELTMNYEHLKYFGIYL